MRPTHRRLGLIVGLVVSLFTAAAGLIVVGATTAQAMRGGHGMTMNRGFHGSAMRSSRMGSGARSQRFHSNRTGKMGSSRAVSSRSKGSGSAGRGRGKDTGVSTADRGSRNSKTTRTTTDRNTGKGNDQSTADRGDRHTTDGNTGKDHSTHTSTTDRGGDTPKRGGDHSTDDGKGTHVDTGGDRPPRDRRPGDREPGPVIGTGVVIGAGVAVGTGVAVASPGPVIATPGPVRAAPQNGALPPSSGPRLSIPPANENRFVRDEVVLEFAGNFPRPAITQLLARNRLSQIEIINLSLSNSTLVRAQILGGRAVRTVLGGLANEATLRSGQPNYLFATSQDQVKPAPDFTPSAPAMPAPTPVVATAAAIPKGGDPAQYALEKLHLNEAHSMATGEKVLVAVIDSGVDVSHPELVGAIAGSFDALGKSERPHMHGTAIAGAIVAHARLMGAAPAAKVLAIRAFSASGASAEATTFAIIKGIEYASQQNARVINMSFAGPFDSAMARELAGAKAHGAVLIAASGNYGPKSPPQFPAADLNVIAVSATDADDKLFRASNIGPHIALSAPGVDILLPVPERNYEMISGTSFAAAYVSGVAALVIQRAPGLSPDAVRRILESSARDIGPPGRDPQFGAGLVDAFQAIIALQANASAKAAEPPPSEAKAQ